MTAFFRILKGVVIGCASVTSSLKFRNLCLLRLRMLNHAKLFMMNYSVTLLKYNIIDMSRSLLITLAYELEK